MQLLKYNGFIKSPDVDFINENIQQSKKFLKDRYVSYKVFSKYANGLSYEQKEDLKTGMGNLKITDFPENVQADIKQEIWKLKLSEQEIKQIERHPDFAKIKEILGDRNFGYAYLFVYFHFVEKVPLEEIKTLFDKMMQYTDLFAKQEGGSPGLRRPIASYIDPEVTNNNEHLLDDLNQLDIYRKYKRFIDQMPAALKKLILEAPVAVKRGISDCAVAFDDLGKDPLTGHVDEEEKRALQRCHLRIVKRYTTARELLTGTQNYINGLSNSNKTKFYKAIEAANEKLMDYGADIVFDEGGILVLEIKSFPANRMLNASTSHCIKDSVGHWDSYVGGDNNYNKQYYIYNFNLGPADNMHIIGITIEPGQKIRACHAKNDQGIASNCKEIFNQFEVKAKLPKNSIWSHLTPMSPSDIDQKKRRVVANRELIKPNLTIEQIRKYIAEDGADPNTGHGQALHNAVEEHKKIVDANKKAAGAEQGDAVEKTEPEIKAYNKAKLLIDFGANPNFRAQSKGNKMEHTISKAGNLDMIKLLVAAGSELTQEVFKSITDDYDAIKYCLEQGLDPNFDNGLALRLSSRSGNIDTIKLVIEYGANWKGEKNMPLCWAAEHGQKGVIEWFWEKGLKDNWQRPMNWLRHSRKLTKAQKEDMLDWLQKFVDDGRSKLDESSLQIQKDGKYKKFADYVRTHLKADRDRPKR